MGLLANLSPAATPEIHPTIPGSSKDHLQPTVTVMEKLIDNSDTESEHENEPSRSNITSDRRRQQNLAFEKW